MKKLLLIVFSVAMIAGVYAEPPHHHPHRRMSASEINQRRLERQEESIQRGFEHSERFAGRVLQMIENSMIGNAVTGDGHRNSSYVALVNATRDPYLIYERSQLMFRVFLKDGALCSFGDENLFIFMHADEFENYENRQVGQYVPMNYFLKCDHTKIPAEKRKGDTRCSKCNYTTDIEEIDFKGWYLYRNGTYHIHGVRIPIYSLRDPKKNTATQK